MGKVYKNHEQYKEEVKNKYGDRFDVSMVTSATDIFPIKCTKHNTEFNTCIKTLAESNTFRNGCMCKYCFIEFRLEEQFSDIDNYKYSIELDEKTIRNSKIKTFCPIHGSDEEGNTYRAISKQDSICKHCSNEKRLLKRAVSIYGEQYTFRGVVFGNSKDKITPVCKDHGVFETGLSRFLNNGVACPKCIKKHDEERGFPYLFKRFSHIYDLSMVNLEDDVNGVHKFSCREHGHEFESTIKDLSKYCPVCVNEAKAKKENKKVELNVSNIDNTKPKSNEDYFGCGYNLSKHRQGDKEKTLFIPFLLKNIPEVFVEQYPVQRIIDGNTFNYYIDAYVTSKRLAIEFDESAHQYQVISDLERDSYIEETLNCRVIRIKEYDLINDPNGVIKYINHSLRGSVSSMKDHLSINEVFD